MAKPALIRCPICQKESDFFAEPVGSFCSPRCQLIDLGKWLGEEYRVSEPLRPDHFGDDEEGSETDLDTPE
jgi:endogenous inhibitor of DNA gyrase (YacG/DUF329 family)